MTTYIGMPGQLAPVRCASKLLVRDDRKFQEIVTLGGKRKFLIPRTSHRLRTWELTFTNPTPQTVLALEQFVLNREPVVFVDSFMQNTNMLTPQESLMEPGTHTITGGTSKSKLRFTLDDYSFDCTFYSLTSKPKIVLPYEVPLIHSIPETLPALPDVPLVFSFYARHASPISITMNFTSHAGSIAGLAPSLKAVAARPSNAMATRFWCTFKSVWRSTDLTIVYPPAEFIALPQLHVGTQPIPFHVGAGVKRVVLTPAERSFSWATQKRTHQDIVIEAHEVN